MHHAAPYCVLPAARHAPAILAAVVVGLLVGAAAAQPLGSPVPPTIDNPNRFAVTNVPAAKRIMFLAATRRIDFSIIGDSNTRQLDISGHEDGMGRAFAARFGMYATRVDSCGGPGIWGAGVLSEYSSAGPPFDAASAPHVMDPYYYDIPQFPSGLAFLPGQTTLPNSYNLGLGLLPDNPVNIAGPLRYHLTDIPIQGGSFWFSVRALYPGSALSDIISVQPALPTPTAQRRDIAFNIPLGSRPATGILICPADLQNNHASVGPIAMLYNRVENLSRASGIAYSPMWAQGGQDARKALEDMLSSPRNLTAMSEWMRQAVRLQNDDGVLVVHILHGGNDAGDASPSLGPIGGLQSNTLAGHEDNIRGIIAWLRTIWTSAGYDPANLYFLLGPYHPRDDRLDFQHDFETAWRNIATTDPQVVAMSGTMLSTAAEFLAKGFNRSELDAAHLALNGYWQWGTVTVRTLSRAACPPDFDENGQLAVADIFAFLDAWLDGHIAADFNYSGTLEIQDIFDFLTAWFNGC